MSWPSQAAVEEPPRVRFERRADRAVHGIGVAAGVLGAAALAFLAASRCDMPHQLAVAAYLVGLLAMLGCSAAYNTAPASARRDFLRRFDHAAIFLLIAGTYMPFAAAHLDGARGILVTALVSLVAVAGMAAKLLLPGRFERLAIVAYLSLGWLEFLGLRPALGALDATALRLLVAGGLVYSGGLALHLRQTLPFNIALWHALVLVAAACHYAAVLGGVVLAACRA